MLAKQACSEGVGEVVGSLERRTLGIYLAV